MATGSAAPGRVTGGAYGYSAVMETTLTIALSSQLLLFASLAIGILIVVGVIAFVVRRNR
ncbi:hypothetical protein SAMN02745673_01636 [Marinactinospora thermotolerans DSM 45154]|uniref:Uncharacterized protein n=1 Tax=Marinactinospora thermotolerans DSM 45154 TaxID=1122192 RepID=A0A1T4P4Z1_9ACTN|nr:hypothetical protein SAMN02745673_01636 [Marinactinospora thermotolerans DSM 45154]